VKAIKFIAAGVGPGDPSLVTIGALRAIEAADLVLAPVAGAGRVSVAGEIVRAHLNVETVPVVFPMTRDEKTRDAILLEQLEALHPRWAGARSAALPVVGDSSLYPTAAYFYGVWKRLDPSVELELVPGVSAHSLAAARSGRFLALGEEVFSIIPGTAKIETIANALRNCDSAALYKPSALGENLRPTVESTGPWREMLRVDRAGLPSERLVEGDPALYPSAEYLSILLLWRRRR
jgi:precorrin-2/cobalt-factor-2 C20-methyltransferase